MKASFRKTVLLGAVVLTGMLATSHDFSAPTQPVTASNSISLFISQQSAGALSTRIPQRHVVINKTLARLQEGILGNSMAESL